MRLRTGTALAAAILLVTAAPAAAAEVDWAGELYPAEYSGTGVLRWRSEVRWDVSGALPGRPGNRHTGELTVETSLDEVPRPVVRLVASDFDCEEPGQPNPEVDCTTLYLGRGPAETETATFSTSTGQVRLVGEVTGPVEERAPGVTVPPPAFDVTLASDEFRPFPTAGPAVADRVWRTRDGSDWYRGSGAPGPVAGLEHDRHDRRDRRRRRAHVRLLVGRLRRRGQALPPDRGAALGAQLGPAGGRAELGVVVPVRHLAGTRREDVHRLPAARQRLAGTRLGAAGLRQPGRAPGERVPRRPPLRPRPGLRPLRARRPLRVDLRPAPAERVRRRPGERRRVGAAALRRRGRQHRRRARHAAVHPGREDARHRPRLHRDQPGRTGPQVVRYHTRQARFEQSSVEVRLGSTMRLRPLRWTEPGRLEVVRLFP